MARRQVALSGVSRALVAGVVAGGPSLIPTGHGGALLSGGKPGHKGVNRYTARKRAEVVRGRFLGQLEGIADDLSALLSTARESDERKYHVDLDATCRCLENEIVHGVTFPDLPYGAEWATAR